MQIDAVYSNIDKNKPFYCLSETKLRQTVFIRNVTSNDFC